MTDDPVKLAREIVEKHEAKSGPVVTDESAAAMRWWSEHEPERHLQAIARAVLSQHEQIDKLGSALRVLLGEALSGWEHALHFVVGPPTEQLAEDRARIAELRKLAEEP